MCYKKLSPPEKWIIKAIPILVIVGSFMHFLYQFSGKNKIIALIASVNESVWEHSKLVLLPVILFWFLYYILKGKKQNISINKWFTSALASLITALITIPLLFYFYTEAFGFESLFIDIFIFILAVIFGQLIGLHFYIHSKGFKWYIPVTIILLITLFFMTCTYYPFELPIFKDSGAGQYGIIS